MCDVRRALLEEREQLEHSYGLEESIKMRAEKVKIFKEFFSSHVRPKALFSCLGAI